MDDLIFSKIVEKVTGKPNKYKPVVQNCAWMKIQNESESEERTIELPNNMHSHKDNKPLMNLHWYKYNIWITQGIKN